MLVPEDKKGANVIARGAGGKAGLPKTGNAGQTPTKTPGREAEDKWFSEYARANSDSRWLSFSWCPEWLHVFY